MDHATFVIRDGDTSAYGRVNVAVSPCMVHLSVEDPEQALALAAALGVEPRQTEGVTELGSTWQATDAVREIGGFRLSVCCMKVRLSDAARAAS